MSMKKSIIALLVVAMALVNTSCRDSYDDYEGDRGATIGFTSPPLELSLPPGGEIPYFPVPFFVTSVSSSDRTFQVVVVEEETTLTADNYTIDMEVLVPANERSGTLAFSAVNNSISADDFQNLVIAFESTSDVTSGKKYIISLKSTN